MPWHMPPCRTKTPLHPYRQRGRQHQRVCFRINQFLVVSDASNRQVSWLTALIHPHLPVLTVAGLTPGCMLPITVTSSHRLLSVSLFSRALPLTPVAYTLCMIMPKWLFFKLLSRKSPKSRKTLRAFFAFSAVRRRQKMTESTIPSRLSRLRYIRRAWWYPSGALPAVLQRCSVY